MFLSNSSFLTTELNFVTGIFNEVAAFYNSESVNLTLSEDFMWTSQDPISQLNSLGALSTFDKYRSFFNGDIGMLLSTANANLGGIAHLSALCTYQRTAYADIYNTYATL